MKSKQRMRLVLLASLLLTGCRAVTAPPAGGAAAATPAPVTQQIQFDPNGITPSIDQPVLAGACVASLRVPRTGAYSCTAETGALFDPCFVLDEDGSLGCQPNPPAGRYAALITATNAPLPAAAGVAQPAPFYLNLAPGTPPCAAGVNTPMQLDGHEVTWRCEAPGAWIVGDLRTDRPDWLADYVVTDSSGAQITYGPEATFVVTAWMY
jgi:hypothetical protein